MIHQEEKMIHDANLLKAIAHPIRLCLVGQLADQDDLTVSYFTGCMDASQSNISQHLGKLRDQGIVSYRKEGNQIKYRLENESVREIVRIFKEEKA